MNTVRIIKPSRHVDAVISVPPSKSYTNRALIASALADGISILHQPSRSDDSKILISALKEFGIQIKEDGNKIEIVGSNGKLKAPAREVYVGNTGTAMRFLTSLGTLPEGETILVGDEQMNRRPIKDLIDSLRSMGTICECNNGYPPVKVRGGNFRGGSIGVNASVSTQFVSSLLLISPYAKKPVTLYVGGKLKSMPYVDMTLQVMRSFGAIIENPEMNLYHIDNTQPYIGHDFLIESDATSASYFLGAAAITKGRVIISNLSSESLQGDINFLNILSDMGCTIIRHDDNIEIHGGKLHGIEIDMHEMPDCVPTLAVISLFASGTTIIRNIGQLRYKETDRLSALTAELSKLGAKVEISNDELIISPNRLRGAEVETYNDHRIAMSFAMAGLGIEGIGIKNPMCVTKSFPDFWDEFNKLEGNN